MAKKAKSIKYWLPVLLVMVMVLGLLPFTAHAYYSYMGYDTNDDSAQTTYSQNWTAQSFNTLNTTISIYGVQLRLYRVGTPGTLNVMLRASTGPGEPTGANLTVGTYNADSLTTDTAGEWVYINFTSVYLLSVVTNYTVVASAPSGNSTNQVAWRTDASSPTYNQGLLSYSTDAGASWTTDSGQDAMFRIIGEPVDIAFKSVKIFQNVFVGTDQLVLVYYNLTYTVQPSELCQNLYSIWASGTGREISDYGHGITSVYLAPDYTVTWGSTFDVTINGTPQWDYPPSEAYSVQVVDYEGSLSTDEGRRDLYNYIVTTLIPAYATATGKTLTYTHDSYGTILNLEGAAIIEKAIPGIGGIIPIIGAILYWQGPEDIEAVDIRDYEFGNWTYQEDLEGRLPANMSQSFEDLGSVFGLSGTFTSAWMVVLIYLTAVGFMYAGTKNPLASMVLASPLFAIATLVGLLPLIWLVIPAFLVVVAVAYFIFLRGT